MNAGPRDVEIPSNQRIVARNLKSQFLSGILGQLSYRRIVDAFVHPFQLGVFNNQRLQRRIACSLAIAEYRRVGGAAAVQPRRCRVNLNLMQIVMTVPFEPLGRDADLSKTVDEFWDAPQWQVNGEREICTYSANQGKW